MRIAEILDVPCREACDAEVPRFHDGNRAFAICSAGFCVKSTTSSLIVDDKECTWEFPASATCSTRRACASSWWITMSLGRLWARVEEAELIEILDHHRLGNMSTHAPIRFSVDVVGSTSTLVSERTEEAGLSAPPHRRLAAGGLLSDTLILTSPTTTGARSLRCRAPGALGLCPQWAAGGETVHSFGKQVLRSGAGLRPVIPRTWSATI